MSHLKEIAPRGEIIREEILAAAMAMRREPVRSQKLSPMRGAKIDRINNKTDPGTIKSEE